MLHLRVQQGSIFAPENLGYKAPPGLEDVCDHCQRCQDELRLHKLVHVVQPSHCAQEFKGSIFSSSVKASRRVTPSNNSRAHQQLGSFS